MKMMNCGYQGNHTNQTNPGYTRPRRIAIYLPALEGGGAERVMLDVAKGLAQRGLSVDLVLVRAEGPYLELLPAQVRLIDLSARRTVASLPGLLRYLRRERPDALLSTVHTNVIALIVKKFFINGLRVIVRRASTFTTEFANVGFKIRMTMRLEKYLMSSADTIVANSRGMADDLKRNVVPNSSHLVQVIPNPVTCPDHAEKAALAVEHPWFGDPRIPVILSVGRLIPAKDHSTLLRAFAEVVKSRPARLVILGEGADRGKLIALAQKLGIADVVDLPGFHLNPFAYMAKASVFALSSVYEGFPNVLVQSMACGTPVVSTDCLSGPREILEDGKWGRLVPVGDWQSLAEAVLRTLGSPLSSDLLIVRAEAYSARASIDQFMELVSK